MGTTRQTRRRVVILVRHASRNADPYRDEALHSIKNWNEFLGFPPPDYKKPGMPMALAIAARLCGELDAEFGNVKFKAIWHSPHTAALQTATGYQHAFEIRGNGGVPLVEKKTLDPGSGCAAQIARDAERTLFADPATGPEAIVVVGHQPLLTEIARHLSAWPVTFWPRLPANTLPLAGAEAACIEMTSCRRGILLWMLTEKPDALMEDLKTKIQSKYDVAKFFLGAFVVNTGFLLSGEIWKIKSPIGFALVCEGFFFVMLALGLTAATLFSYDRLMMPTAFWTGTSPPTSKKGKSFLPRRWTVRRPPSQAHVVLFYEMVHVWSVFFIPALCCAFGAVTSFLVALLHGGLARTFGWAEFESLPWLFAPVGGAIAAFGGAYLWYRNRRPELGFED